MRPSLFAVPSSTGAYPIVGIQYLDFYTGSNVRAGVSHFSDVVTLVQFVTNHSPSPDTRPAAPLGYTYLDSSISDAVWNQQNGTNPCITS